MPIVQRILHAIYVHCYHPFAHVFCPYYMEHARGHNPQSFLNITFIYMYIFSRHPSMYFSGVYLIHYLNFGYKIYWEEALPSS